MEYIDDRRMFTKSVEEKDHDAFSTTIKVGETVISYKFYGGVIRKEIRDHIKVLLATTIHQQTNLQITLMSGLVSHSVQMEIWIEDQIIADLEKKGIEQSC